MNFIFPSHSGGGSGEIEQPIAHWPGLNGLKNPHLNHLFCVTNTPDPLVCHLIIIILVVVVRQQYV